MITDYIQGDTVCPSGKCSFLCLKCTGVVSWALIPSQSIFLEKTSMAQGNAKVWIGMVWTWPLKAHLLKALIPSVRAVRSRTFERWGLMKVVVSWGRSLGGGYSQSRGVSSFSWEKIGRNWATPHAWLRHGCLTPTCRHFLSVSLPCGHNQERPYQSQTDEAA